VWVQDFKKTLTGGLRSTATEQVFNSQQRQVAFMYKLTTANKLDTGIPREITLSTVVGQGSSERMGYLFCNVYNAAGDLVAQLVDRREVMSGEEADIVWNGKYRSSQFGADVDAVPEGRYRFVFWFEDFTGRTADVLDTNRELSYATTGPDGKIRAWVTVDNTAPTIVPGTATPYYFSPNGSGRVSNALTSVCTYTFTDNLASINPALLNQGFADYKIYREIVADANFVVRTNSGVPVTARANDRTTYTETWDGKYGNEFVGSGNKTPATFVDGKYLMQIVVADLAGNASSATVEL
jgi:hypothetical protein